MKKSIFVAVFLVFAFPLFANASWWNPISWFSFFHHKQVIVQPLTVLSELPAIATTTPIATTKPEKPVIKVAPKKIIKQVPKEQVVIPVSIPATTQSIVATSTPQIVTIPSTTTETTTDDQQTILDQQKHDAIVKSEQAIRQKYYSMLNYNEDGVLSTVTDTDYAELHTLVSRYALLVPRAGSLNNFGKGYDALKAFKDNFDFFTANINYIQ